MAEKPGSALILIAEDEPDILKLVQLTLSAGGFKAEAFPDGAVLLERLKKEPPPDLILLDVMMPGINGYEVCRKIREDARFAAIPVVFLTAKTQDQDYIKGAAAGGTSYIPKPFDVDLLAASVARFLPEKRGA